MFYTMQSWKGDRYMVLVEGKVTYLSIAKVNLLYMVRDFVFYLVEFLKR